MQCPLQAVDQDEEGEAAEPLCTFGIEGTQLSDNTWSFDFPPFETGARVSSCHQELSREIIRGCISVLGGYEQLYFMLVRDDFCVFG